MADKYEKMMEEVTRVMPSGRRIKVLRVKPEYYITHEEFERRLEKTLRKIIRRQEKQRKAS